MVLCTSGYVAITSTELEMAYTHKIAQVAIQIYLRRSRYSRMDEYLGPNAHE
jgi:hypothetical protein